ncbi:methyltransferase domain-containing protein [Frankia sp. AiPs1]|uniref:class I SAM-dependent methyltransferase n=1 Tax=Frankia sp. AiPs1 TaxID=573493 RepID=UPI0020432764|nr:class I SAM-dependent methyltransferase [Frankia sp. AiPs1]MCM3921989.1 methyltransferase domain-containing protein [Frankia sp. AiPs1]
MVTEVGVDASNASQFASWDGEGGAFWVSHADRFDEGVAAYRDRFLTAAAIDERATVLDVGCGGGRTTLDAARCAAAGSVLGVDLSSAMLGLARRRAEREHVTNATFEQADAQIHPFPTGIFDVVVSRHGVMFFGDPVAAFTNLARALRPGGRIVLLTWQPFERNEWLQAFFTSLAAGRDIPVPPSDAPSPFALDDPTRIRSLLNAAGFCDVQMEGLVESMYFGRDPDDAFRFVSAQHAGLVRDLDPGAQGRAFDDLRADLAGHQTERGVLYDSAAWLIQARRA